MKRAAMISRKVGDPSPTGGRQVGASSNNDKAASRARGTVEAEPSPKVETLQMGVQPLPAEASALGRAAQHEVERAYRLLVDRSDYERRRLEALMDVLPVGVAITDAEGTPVESNAAFAQTLGIRAATGEPSVACGGPWAASSGAPVQPEERAAKRAIRGGKRVVGQLLEVERGDGAHGFVVESAAPIRDASGRTLGTVIAVQDITEWQRELQASGRIARLYAMLSQVNKAVVHRRSEHDLHDDVCRILADTGGYPLAWIGQVREGRVVVTAAHGPAVDYLEGIEVTVDGPLGHGPTGTALRERRAVVNHDFLLDTALAPWRERAARYGFRSSAAFPLCRGGVVVASLTLYAHQPAAFDHAHVDLLQALAADLSYAHDAIEDERLRGLAEESLARSEAQLRESNVRKSDFLAVLSHELRNPLAPIKNSLAVLHRAPPGGEQAVRATAVIERQVDQLARLVDDLLDVTRLSRGKLRIEPKRMDLVEIVVRTAEDHRLLFDRGGIRFDTELPSQPIHVAADGPRLVQAIGNLLANAAKFTPAGGGVRLRLARGAGDTAEVRIRDSGLGIAPEMMPHLFEPFMQAESTLDRSKGGLGLGLALVKGVVELHGGTVEAFSAGLGAGSEFVLGLPIDCESTPEAVSTWPAPGATVSKRVLIIEDNRDAADSLREVLTIGGHRVEVAGNGRDGVRRALTFAPDIVICDIGLPEMDGYQVARTFRADPNLRTAVLIALTGYAQPEDLHRAMAAGFDAHIAKPASIEAIEAALARTSHPTDG